MNNIAVSIADASDKEMEDRLLAAFRQLLRCNKERELDLMERFVDVDLKMRRHAGKYQVEKGVSFDEGLEMVKEEIYGRHEKLLNA